MIYNGEFLINDLPLKVYDNKFKLFFNGGTAATAKDILEIHIINSNSSSLQIFLNGDFEVDRLYDNY